MNNAHLHLVVNHLPIIFPIVGVIILIIAIITKSETSKRNAYLIFILGAITSVFAMATGEGAEESIEHLQGISENLIKTHEESAELFAGISYLLGVFSLIALFASIKKYTFSKYFPYAVGILAVITLFFAQQAGNSGGEIRHSEIRNNALNHNAGNEDVQKNESEHSEDHEEEEHER